LLLYVDLLHTQPVSHPRQEEHACVRHEVFMGLCLCSSELCHHEDL
jgi:hypothetical protein